MQRRTNPNRKLVQWTLSVLAVALSLGSVSARAEAQERKVPDTYKAVTTNMTPSDVELKADILQWSTEDERAAVIAALMDAEDPSAALGKLPTIGVVWRKGSAVGDAIKYATRTTAADGSERITLVTDKRIGATSFNPWQADDPSADAGLGYSVIQMSTSGEGTMSLGAKLVIDAETHTVSLDQGSQPPLLTKVRKEPKPYWADSN